MNRRAMVPIVAVVALVVSSCGLLHRDDNAAPAPTSTSESTPDGALTRFTAEVDGVHVEVTPSAADRDRGLTIEAVDATIPTVETRLASTSPISITLDGGAGQPSQPLKVQFDLSDRPDLAAAITDKARPVLESVSATNPDQRDMFTATWDPGTKTVTAEVTHLTNFWLSVFNVFSSIETGIGKAFEFVRGTTDSPCREHSELSLNGTDYVLTTVSPGAVAGCLAEDNGAVAIDFTNATGGFYTIAVAPGDIGGAWVVTQALSMADSAGSLVASATPNSKGVLAGRSAGRLTLNSGISEGDVRLQPQPQGILTKSLLSGVGMLGLDLGPLDNIPETWDCFATIANTTKLDGSASIAEMVSGIGGISQCLVTQAKVSGGDGVRMAALHRLGVAVDLLTELPTQLGDFIAVGLQQAARNSVLDFRLRTAVPTPTETPTSQPPAPESTVIDRVDVSTWAYDRIEGDNYKADNNGGKSVAIYWKSYAGEKQIRSGCTSTLEVTGPGFAKTVDSSGCDSYNPGTYVKVKSPGTYTATIRVHQDGQPDFVAERNFTIQR